MFEEDEPQQLVLRGTFLGFYAQKSYGGESSSRSASEPPERASIKALNSASSANAESHLQRLRSVWTAGRAALDGKSPKRRPRVGYWGGDEIGCSTPRSIQNRRCSGYETSMSSTTKASRQWGSCSEPADEFRGVAERRSTSGDSTSTQSQLDGIKAFKGHWRVESTGRVDPGFSGGTWTLDHKGHAWLYGMRFSSLYDIVLSREGGTIRLLRGDGWSAELTETDLERCDLVVWTNPTEPGRVTWTRIGGKLDSGESDENSTTVRAKLHRLANELLAEGGGRRGGQDKLACASDLIEALPVWLNNDMQKLSSHALDNVKSEVERLISEIQPLELPAKDIDNAINNVKLIPVMVRNLLDSGLDKGSQTVKLRLHEMENFLQQGKEEQQSVDLIAERVLRATEELEKMAMATVVTAVCDSHQHATKQVNLAVASLRGKLHAYTANWDKPQEAPSWGAAESYHWSKSAMDGAGTGMRLTYDMTNQVIADELLRAKIRADSQQQQQPGSVFSISVDRDKASAPPSKGSKALQPAIRNPGSVGHPEICLRPCIYFAAGSCEVGDKCSYCHLEHSKRPCRLDRRHRTKLKQAALCDLVADVIPILRRKAAGLHLSAECSYHFETFLTALARHGSQAQVAARGSGLQGVAVAGGYSRAGKAIVDKSMNLSGLLDVLRVMGFRPLLLMLSSKLSPEDPECQMVQTLLKKIQEDGAIGDRRLSATE
eukprot:TRINITY_DN34253_c0_g1_i1.p1 TRINITY_DN34253_c0_g1~~TRINITY_DN34253_c0_g1_i1.p1  ORF type:complete len:717 (+),score=173.37 TRINITY_DN34253_c0_g1_i1:92-2242(+)